MVVTERMSVFSAISLTWIPERPGNWLLHCHFAIHLVPPPRNAANGNLMDPAEASTKAHAHENHALTGMVWFGALHALQARFDLPMGLQWALWAGSIPAALVVALVFHRWVDTPVQAWLARRLERPRTATA